MGATAENVIIVNKLIVGLINLLQTQEWNGNEIINIRVQRGGPLDGGSRALPSVVPPEFPKLITIRQLLNHCGFLM